MAFTAGEITNIANAALDFYLNKGDTFKQSIQAKPMLGLMERKAKSFPGGKGNVSLAVKGVFGAGGVNDGVAGYTHNDAVSFYTPANIQRVNYPWREHHIGITLTHTELKIDGISVTDEGGDGRSTSNHDQREMTALVNLMADKLEDFGQQYAIKMNALFWADGVADAKALAGIRSIIVDNPTTGTLGGLTRTTNTWWRNRAATTANAGAGGQGPITSATTSGGVLIQFIQAELRQLTRYSSGPDTAFCGSSFLGALETEFRANGNYSMTGFTANQDGSVGNIQIGKLRFQYDPTLDDLSLPKRAYLFDSKNLYLMKMDGEWRHPFTPSRPVNQFVLYKSLTCTGQMVASQVNGCAVYDIT